MPWSWSFSDIASYFRSEDLLYEHWLRVFPDRILSIPYEDLAADPATWIPRILNFVDLPDESQVYEPHKAKRTVTTASVAQVRAPISTSRIGLSAAYKEFTEEFRRAYYGQN